MPVAPGGYPTPTRLVGRILGQQWPAGFHECVRGSITLRALNTSEDARFSERFKLSAQSRCAVGTIRVQLVSVECVRPGPLQVATEPRPTVSGCQPEDGRVQAATIIIMMEG